MAYFNSEPQGIIAHISQTLDKVPNWLVCHHMTFLARPAYRAQFFVPSMLIVALVTFLHDSGLMPDFWYWSLAVPFALLALVSFVLPWPRNRRGGRDE